MDDNGNQNWTHLVWAVGGLLAGSWWARNEIEESKKSRAEMESPEDAERGSDSNRTESYYLVKSFSLTDESSVS